jgi:uncharacterized protein YfdQ (DUF2303 family)
MDQNSIAAAIEAGKNITQLHKVEGFKPALTAPHLSGPVALTPEKLKFPRFLTAAPRFQDSGAFIAYVNAFKQEATRIFYVQDGKFLAVIDYHIPALDGGPIAPQVALHGDHMACLNLIRSPEWITWANNSEKAMGQQEFAEFVEDNARDILQPSPMEMLEIATGLQATVGATFRSAINQANGTVQLNWDEQVEGTVKGTGKAIPAQFQIGVRPFMGTERYPVDCRLRYRVAGGSLKLHYKALHLDPITEAALDGIVAKVRDETGIAPALGSHDPAAFAKGT